jgi:hypothetical protein
MNMRKETIKTEGSKPPLDVFQLIGIQIPYNGIVV